jgi:hypothetical protein
LPAAIATKVWLENGKSGRKARVVAEAKDSLRWLRADATDFGQVHRPGPNIPAAEVTEAPSALKKGILIIAVAWPLLCSPAFAQAGAVTPTPSLSATTPLGMVPGAPVGATGIPLGATEIGSPGVSPLQNTAGGTGCSTLGTPPSTIYGSTATYDGGGMAPGTAAPATAAAASDPTAMSGTPTTSAMVDTSGLSGMCGSGSSSLAASSTDFDVAYDT